MTETTILNESAVSEIEDRANAAEPGPWQLGGNYWDRNVVTADKGDHFIADCGKHPMSAEFIAHAREDIPALCDTVKHLWAESKSKKIELLQLSGRGDLLAKEHVKFDSLDEVAAVRNELDRLRNVVIPELQQHSERLTTGLINIYHVITNEQCERHVALGMATSAVSSLQSQLEQLRAENEALRKELANSEKYQAQLLDRDS